MPMPRWQPRTRRLRSIRTRPILYYIKGQGLIQKATVDPKTNRIVLPPDCTEAYQRYLALAPTGPYAAEVRGFWIRRERRSTPTTGPPRSSKLNYLVLS